MSQALIRPGRKEDAKRVWELRNDPVARRWFKSQEEIPFDEQWYLKKYFTGGKSRCYVLELEQRVIGYCRLDYRVEDGTYEVSVAIEPAQYGKGYGTRMLSESLDMCRDRPLVALINKENAVSVKLFEKFGFKTEGDDKGFLRLVLIK